MLLLKAWIKLNADILRLDKFVFQTYLCAYADLSWIMSRDGLTSSTRDSLRLPRSFLALSFSRSRTWSKVLEIPYDQKSVIWIVAFCWSPNSKNHYAFACRPIHSQIGITTQGRRLAALTVSSAALLFFAMPRNKRHGCLCVLGGTTSVCCFGCLRLPTKS